VESESVEPTFVVSESRANIGPGKGLIVGCIGVLEASMDEGALVICEEGCGGWVVVDKEVGTHGDDYGEESFLLHLVRIDMRAKDIRGTNKNENPSPPIVVSYSFHEPDSVREDATKCTSQ
jgi:hypothetical protein